MNLRLNSENKSFRNNATLAVFPYDLETTRRSSPFAIDTYLFSQRERCGKGSVFSALACLLIHPAILRYSIIGLLLISVHSFAQEPYFLLDTPKSFTGTESQTADAGQIDAIRIGLFAPGEGSSPVAKSLIQGVSLALDLANQNGGYRGVPFALIRRWADNPWGAGSKEALALVHDDRVWAILGSTAGDGTHVVEQIATKLWLPLISPIVSDPSLTHINLPWIFRLPPDDRAQADVLIGDGVVKQGLKKVGLLTATDHDGRYAADELRKVMMERGVAPAFHLTIDPQEDALESLVERIGAFQPDGLVLRLPVKQMSGLLSSLTKHTISIPLFIPWIPGLQAGYLTPHYSGTIAVLEPFAAPMRCGAYLKFNRDYIRIFGEKPDACAVYGYDAGGLIVQAIRNAGLARTKLAEAIRQLSGFQGASGSIEWDNGGGNQSKPVIQILNKP